MAPPCSPATNTSVGALPHWHRAGSVGRLELIGRKRVPSDCSSTRHSPAAYVIFAGPLPQGGTAKAVVGLSIASQPLPLWRKMSPLLLTA